VVVDGWRDHDVGGFQHAPLVILGHRPIVFQFEMRTVFFRLGAERNDHDRFGPEDFFGFLPGEVFE
jgi:hypothetical protein